MRRKILLIVPLIVLPALGQQTSPTGGGGVWDGIRDNFLYLAIVVALPAAAIVVWRWHEKRGREKLKDKIMQYLDGNNPANTATMIDTVFNGKEPRGLMAALKELAEEGAIKDVPVNGHVPFNDFRRLR